MIDQVQRVLRIQPGEGRKTFLFALLGAVLHGGLAVGGNAVDAIFLSQAGATWLPVIYVSTPLVMLLYIPASSYLLARFGINRVFDLTLGILLAGAIVLFLLFSATGGAPVSLVLLCGVKLYANMWLFALYTLYWNFTDSYFDIQDGKRLFPLFSAGTAFGAMVGGALVTVLIRFVPVASLFLVWAAAALLTAPLVVHLRRTCAGIDEDPAIDDTPVRFLAEVRQMLATLRDSRFVRNLALVIFLTLSITLICEYQYMNTFTDTTKAAVTARLAPDLPDDGTPPPAATVRAVEDATARDLASLFGWLGVGVNAFILLMNLFLFNRLITWLGVRNLALVQPLVYVAVFSFFLLHYGFTSALAGFFAYQGIMIAVEQNNQNFLFNAMPAQVRKQMRTFIEGIAEPLAVALAGGFLLVYGRGAGGGSVDRVLAWALGEENFLLQWVLGGQTVDGFKDAIGVGRLTETGISLIGLLGAVLVLVLALVLRADYLQAMVVNLKRGWLDFSRPARGILGTLGPEERETLTAITRSGDRRGTLAAIRLIAASDPRAALAAWRGFWERSVPAYRRDAQLILVDLLRTDDPLVALDVVAWLEEERPEPIPRLVEELGRRNLLHAVDLAPWLRARDPEKRSAAAVTWWSSWKFERNLDALQAVRGLLQGEAEERRMAVRALGLTGQQRYAHFLVDFLRDPAPVVREEALAALLTLATRDSVRLIPHVLPVVESGTQEQRDLAIRILMRIGDTSCILPLLAAAEVFSPGERRQAEALVADIGLRSVPAVASALQQSSFPYQGRSIAARTLGRLAFPQFDSLAPYVINDEIRRAYEYVSYRAILEQVANRTQGQELLLRCYRDIQTTILDFILELLTIGGRLPSFELLSASLRSSNPKDRADTIETLEQGCDRALFNLLVPLVDERRAARRAHLAATLFPTEGLSAETVAMGSLNSRVPLECASALLALWETAPGQALDICRLVLQENPGRFVRRNVLMFLDKKTDPGVLADIEKVGLFFAAPFFSGFSVLEMAGVAASAEEIAAPAGTVFHRPGDEASALYLVTRGEADVEEEGRRERLGAGAIFGEGCVLGEPAHACTATSRGVRVLRLPKRTLVTAARTYPRVAMELLSRKLRREGHGD
jgi:hypothetical protein